MSAYYIAGTILAIIFTGLAIYCWGYHDGYDAGSRSEFRPWANREAERIAREQREKIQARRGPQI